MHAVELLEKALAFAQQSGYQIRQEWLGGQADGVCEFKGRRWLFVDLSLDPQERLEHVLQSLEEDAAHHRIALPLELQDQRSRRAA